MGCGPVTRMWPSLSWVWDVAQSLSREPIHSTPAREAGDALGMICGDALGAGDALGMICGDALGAGDALGMTSSRPDRCNGTQAEIIWRFVQPFL
jgi:hypothetical protein